MISSRQVSSFDDQVEVLSRVSSGPRVQISRSSARYFAGKSKNCPEANGGYVRVQSSQDVPVIFKDSVMAGGRTIWGIFGHIGRSPSCDIGSTGPMPYRPDY
ncbi:hypothetical protein DY000_02046827 [Brassica cretica]|uniref:Neprosin domain-containing protein n=1 Tax=Brassica cretica TaxID=69181 RepID=A0ABQ7EYB5_BRACR|nr:hypothetical protein DY000_02046827 [Brassica cretica]